MAFKGFSAVFNSFRSGFFTQLEGPSTMTGQWAHSSLLVLIISSVTPKFICFQMASSTSCLSLRDMYSVCRRSSLVLSGCRLPTTTSNKFVTKSLVTNPSIYTETLLNCKPPPDTKAANPTTRLITRIPSYVLPNAALIPTPHTPDKPQTINTRP